MPTSQSTHAVDPTSGLYLPATQNKHVPPSGPVEPALQVQAVETELPTGELEFVGHSKQLNTVPGAVYVPAMQSQFDVVAPEIVEYVLPTQRAQGAEPGELLYVPAVQLVQDPPFGPLDPLLHVHSLRA